MDPFELLIKALGDASGIEDMRPDQEDGAVHLVLDDDLTLFVQPNAEQTHVSIYAGVGLLDETVPADLLLELLSASLFGRGANGASFAIEPTMGQIVLQRTERLAGLEYADFEGILNRFIESAEAWKRQLSPSEPGPGDATPLSDRDPGDWPQMRV